MVAVVVPSSATGDSRCISLEAAVLINRCETCVEVTVRSLPPHGEQAAAPFTAESRTIRLGASTQEKLQGGDSWIISDLKACH